MKIQEVKKLKHGLYKINWKKKEGGGSSLAALGTDREGCTWIAPCNWVSGSTSNKDTWKAIKSVEIIELVDYKAIYEAKHGKS